MESLHARIKRLRDAAKLTQEELGKACGIASASVQQWETEGGTGPRRANRPAAAKAVKVSEIEFEFSVEEIREFIRTQTIVSGPEVAKDAKEEMLLELYRRLLPAQQTDLREYMWSHLGANIASRRHMGEDLRQIEDVTVKDAYQLPPVKPKKPKKPKPKKSKKKPKSKVIDRPQPRTPQPNQDDAQGD